ncbi:MAG: beta/gamma crystallin-related protein [Casimicrobiaceae bacterium]
MKNWMRGWGLALGLGAAWQVGAQIVLYDDDNFRGRSFAVDQPVDDFFNVGYNDRASSATVRGGTWQICSDANFRGRCVNLTPGDYPSLAAVGLNDRVSSVRAVNGGVVPPARGRITLFDFPKFDGRGVSLENDVRNFDQIDLNDRAHSLIVESGTWQLCENADYRGSCVSLEPGRYPELGALAGRLSSAKLLPPVAGGPPPVPAPGPIGGPVGRPDNGRAELFGQRNLQGRALVIDRPIVRDLAQYNFNDRASSMRIDSGYWMFCSDANFEGECRTFGPGDYPTLPPELRNRISSGRRIANYYPYREAPNWRGY